MKIAYYGLAILLGYMFFYYAALSVSDFNPADYGLGQNTTSKAGIFEGDTVGIFPGDKDFNAISAVQRTFKKYKAENKQVVLMLGSSQLHAINKIHPGDRLTVEQLEEKAKQSNIRYIQATSPMASFHDLFLIYKSFRDHNLVPNYLIIPVVYEQLRESPIQNRLLGLANSFDTVENQVAAPVVQEVLSEQLAIKSARDKNSIQRNATINTPQEKFEQFLVAKLDNYVPAFKYRQQLSASLSILYIVNINGLMSKTVGVVSTSSGKQATRYPDIPANLVDWNTRALKSLVRLAEHDGCKIIIYRQPIRPTEGPFYSNREQYDNYFNGLVKAYKNDSLVTTADFENIVPQQYWGITNIGQPDIFHFTNEGHVRLAGEIDSLLKTKTGL